MFIRQAGIYFFLIEGVKGSSASKLALQMTLFKIGRGQSGSWCLIPPAEETLGSRMPWE